MNALVITVATRDEAATEKQLEALGYRRREVWEKCLISGTKEDAETELMRLKVAQFVVTDYWGRSNEFG